MATLREQVRANLAKRRNSEFKEKDGRVTLTLAQQMGVPPEQLSSVLRRMDAAGEIVRDVRSHRTFSVRLAHPATNGSAPEAVAEKVVVDVKLAQTLAQLGAAVVERISQLAAENETLTVETKEAHKVNLQLRRDLDAKQLQIASLERQLAAQETAAQSILSKGAQMALQEFITEVGR